MEFDGMLELDPVLSVDNVSQAPVTFFKNSTIPLFKLVQAINLYLIPVICGVGLAGGAGSFAVLTFTTFRYQPCSHYLAVLTVSDTGFLVALLIAWLTTLHPNLTAAPGYCQVGHSHILFVQFDFLLKRLEIEVEKLS
nr:hypothetical protein BaRGS_033134 [Batillaria attramentaria]